MQHLIDAIRNADVNKYASPELNNNIVFAIRGTDAEINVGDLLAASYEWVDNVQTDNQLSGTCACKIVEARYLDDLEDDELIDLINKAVSTASAYGNKLALVYGIDTQECVNDEWANEIVIDDCTVISLVKG